MKSYFVVACFALMVLTLLGGYYCPSTFWQSFLINSSTAFMALGFGLLLINIYLERDARKDAVKSLFTLSQDAMLEWHNTLLDVCWAKFGRDTYSKLVNEYIKADGKPEALKQSARDEIYSIVKQNPHLMNKADKLEAH